MDDSSDDGLNFFRGVMSMLGIYFVCLWVVCIFMLLF